MLKYFFNIFFNSTFKMSHEPRQVYTLIRNAFRKVKPLEYLLQKTLIKFRCKEARSILLSANQFPTSIESIIKDYEYSIKYTNRNVFQVINLEASLRYIVENSIKGAIVEAGTFTGGASAYALRALIRLEGKSNTRDYWGFDSFEGMPSPTIKDGNQGSKWLTGKNLEELDPSYLGKLKGHSMNLANYEVCLSYLKNTGYPEKKINLIKGWFQETLGANKNQIGEIALLRLDGDFYESTLITLRELYPLVITGGVIIIDDYGGFEGCKKAVDEFFKEQSINAKLIYVENSIRYFFKN